MFILDAENMTCPSLCNCEKVTSQQAPQLAAKPACLHHFAVCLIELKNPLNVGVIRTISVV